MSLQSSMKEYAANAQTVSPRKISMHRAFPTDEPDAPEASRLTVVESDTELAQCVQTIGHESFATCLVDWPAGAVGHDHSESTLTRSNRGGKSGGTSTCYKHIG
jgi:hypothetical protein